MSKRRFEVYAPVIIPTLCRYIHFKRCIDSLSKCTGAEYTDVYVGIDYPTKDEHWEGNKKIREYVKGKSGFNNLYIIIRNRNYGVKDNIDDLKEIVGKNADRYILSEDDNEFSPNFLEYMNEGLTRYKDHPDVIRICASLMPGSSLSRWDKNAFPAMDFNASGVGLWTRKNIQVPFTKDSILKSWKLSYKIFRAGYCTSISRMLFQVNKESQLPDVCLRLYCVLSKKYCIFPSISKVKNWGYDGTGVNSDNNLKLIDIQTFDSNNDFRMDYFEIRNYDEVESYVKQMFVGSKIVNLWVMLNYLFYRITGSTLNSLKDGIKGLIK